MDSLIQALWSTVVPIAMVCALAGTLAGVAFKWLQRKAGGLGGDSKRRKRGARRPLPKVVTPRVQQESVAPTGAVTLDTIGWENFELLTGEIFRRQGYEVEVTSGLGADGGKDVTLRKDGETRLVQCKNLRAGNKVSVSAIRDFYGLIVSEGAAGGIFLTTGSYSPGAREFAAGKPIDLFDRTDVEHLIHSVEQPGENLCDVSGWIDGFAAVAQVAEPTCPFCAKQMKIRRGPTGSVFWGCTGYATHRCRGTREARVELLQARSYQGT